MTLLDRSAIAFLSILDDAIAASAEVLQLAKKTKKKTENEIILYIVGAQLETAEIK